MNAIIRSPARNLGWNLFGDFDNLFGDVVRPLRSVGDHDGTIVPAVDIAETEGAYEVNAELPGVDKDDLEVSINEGILTIKAESRKESKDKRDGRLIRRERRVGSFVRSLRLGDNVDEAHVKAEYKDGVLRLALPKAEAVKPKRIEVNVH